MASLLAEQINWILNRVLRNKRPFPVVDALIKYNQNGSFQGIVLVERLNEPKGWALPGGFVEKGESLEQAVVREAQEETGLTIKIEKQFHTYSDPNRDPRLHTISTLFICKAEGKLKSGSDAKNAKVFRLDQLPALCFDHGLMVADAKKAGLLAES